MTTVLAHSPAYATPATSAIETAARRRRRDEMRIRTLSDAGAGAASVAATPATQQLPFAARASVSVSNGLLYPVLGAVVGSLLLGLPGTILGGVAGWLIAR